MSPAERLATALVLATTDEAPPAAFVDGLDPVARAALDADIEQARAEPEATWLDLTRRAATLDDAGRDGVLRAAIAAVMADAELSDVELQLLEDLARRLDVRAARVRELMREAFQTARAAER